MKRSSKVTLEYTKEEILTILHSAISNAEQVSIENVKYEEDKLILLCVDGVNIIPQTQQIQKIDFDKLFKPIQPETNTTKFFGLKKAIQEILAGGVKCPQEKIYNEVVLRGYKQPQSALRTYMLTLKDLLIECDPKVFQLKEYFNK